MPNRIIRDWTDSETIDKLDANTERFFTRLIMKVDDYGRCLANIRLLKSQLFPLKADIRETDITRWLAACKDSGLIVLYSVANKEYLQINDFRQVLRQKVEKYPPPSDENYDAQMTSGCLAGVTPETKRNETRKEDESECAAAQIYTEDQRTSFKNFQLFIKDHAPNVGKMKEPFKIDQFFKLKESFTTEQIMKLLVKMHNYRPLLIKNNSAYLTFLNWSKNDFEKQGKVIPLSTGPSPAELQAQRILKEVNSKQ